MKKEERTPEETLAECEKRIRKNERMFRWNPFGFMVRPAHENLVFQTERLRKALSDKP